MALPSTRLATRRLLRRPRIRAILWWLASLLSLIIYAPLRGRMDNVGLPVHGAELEERLFWSLPTLWLQHHIFAQWPGPLEWASVVIHSSWFFVPMLAAVLVTWRRLDRVGSFFKWWIALQFIVLPLFALFPLRPPWMANEEVTRIIALRFGGEIHDSNPLAAMPSLHVAFPLMISLWFLRERWKMPAVIMLAYSAIVAFEVVFSGEHYVVDVVGAVVVAVGVMLLARLDYRGMFGHLSKAVAGIIPERRQETEPSPGTLARLYHSERGQVLIEFALLAPLIFVFLFTIVDFGIALDRRITLQHAVREGARAAAVEADPLVAQQATAAQAQGLIDETDVEVCYVDEDGSGQPDALEHVKVSTSFTYQFTIPFGQLMGAFGIDVGGGIEMTPDATSAFENTPAAGAGFVECPP
jgi:Flp pilus assembly protein TadG